MQENIVVSVREDSIVCERVYLFMLENIVVCVRENSIVCERV